MNYHKKYRYITIINCIDTIIKRIDSSNKLKFQCLLISFYFFFKSHDFPSFRTECAFILMIRFQSETRKLVLCHQNLDD